MRCATTRRIHNINDSEFILPEDAVKASTSIRDLGAYLDQVMTLQDHVSRTVSSSLYQLRRINSIRRSLSTSTAVQLVNSFINSRVDYCTSILAGVTNQSYAGNTQLYSTTHIRSPPVRPRHKSHQRQIALTTNSTLCPFQVCNAVYRALHSIAPSFIA